ncbi:sensor domain-containing diguanylate cyclase [Gloeothece verrucosa]|uniref:Diguanylate cyclase with PAS/PAC and GAF sensors n=1 Tax=Gloeothece verrucosa (strain PCC 7822) TaxID=497965 RepID=E0UH96_GLOV7|nr:GGDEF domain-containing protein [Gloeothece verrucosa]ADN16810.1 diguanylate cyclase with PAS/PAC and GAF sensors [Gloeothece verrucosa PCC 7822]
MWEFISNFLAPKSYIPHGHCYLWQTSLVWLHIVSDTLIALAYYSIPIMLIYFIQKRSDVPFRGIFILFSAFILSCGTTHLLAIWTLWYPAYWVSGSLKALTALVSIYTAIELYPLIPTAIALPSPKELESLNGELESQIRERQTAEQTVRLLNAELEKRVKQRTADLIDINQKLEQEIFERQQAESALRESKQFTEQIAHLIPNNLYIYDLVERRNIYCNRLISETLGYSLEELQQLGNSVVGLVGDHIHPADQKFVEQHLKRCLSLTPGSYLEIEYRVKDIKGKWRWLVSRDTLFERQADGKARQIIGIASDITERKEAEQNLQHINTQFAQRVQELEARTQEMIRLGDMTDFLQACLTVKEAENALGDLLKPLFPECHGAVFMIKESRNLVEVVASWGNPLNTQTVFSPDECWALRRGSVHIGEKSFPSLYCQHIHHQPSICASLCLPMMAQGETLGLLYLSFQQPEPLNPAKRKLAETVSKQIAIALANLKLRETLQHQSFRDPLTGLFNRRYLEASMIRELHRATRNNNSLGVIILDIDHFKRFNDTWGHHAGDAVIKVMGKLLQENVRESDIACRYGGEEFIIILPDASLEDTEKRAKQLQTNIKTLNVQVRDQKLESITVSMGVASFPKHGDSYELLLHRADEALYQAKQQGRDRIVCAVIPKGSSVYKTSQG